MSTCKKLSLLSILTLLFVGLSGGAALAGTDGDVTNEVSFSMTDGAAYTYHTTDDRPNEKATLEFKVAFDDAQAGYLQGATIKISYDPELVTLDEVRPADGWGSIDPTPIIIAGDPGEETTVTYILDPVALESTIPISTAATTLAEFDFYVECQEDPETAQITIIYSGAETRVDDGVDVHRVTESGRIDHGSLYGYGQYFALWLAETDGTRDYVGALGTVIEVPVFIGGPFRVASVEATFSYDVDDLEYVGMTDPEASFTDTASSLPTSGQVKFVFDTDEGSVPRHEFSSDIAVNLCFLVKGTWEGGSTSIGIVGVPIFEIAQDAGTCARPFNNYGLGGATISIPEYAAHYSTELLDGFFSIEDDEAEVQVKLTNNFAAGLSQDSIIVNFNLGMDLEGKWITDEAVDFAMFTFGGGPVDEEEVSLRRYLGAGVMDISETAQDMVAFRIDKSDNFTVPTSYDDRFTEFAYMTPFDGYPQFSARVVDVSEDVNLSNGDGLTWDTPDAIEFKMGEYFCDYEQVGNADVTQAYEIQHNFTLDDFRVKIAVDGPHHMYEVIPITGVIVDSYDDVSYKWVILTEDPANPISWAPTTGRTEFASITYTRSGGSNLALKESDGDLPGPIRPPTGYWVTKTSSITFSYYEEGDFYMTEPNSDEEHWVVAISNNVVSKWYVDLNAPNDNISMWGAEMPDDFALLQNYPNPFNPSTEISFGLPSACGVQLDIYNISGQLVETLVSEQMPAGWHSVTWDGVGFASGIYLYRLQAGEFTNSQKMILLK